MEVPGTKKCGHLAGKVLVSTQEHINRLIAARLQADIMKSDLVIISRTDSESGNLLDNKEELPITSDKQFGNEY